MSTVLRAADSAEFLGLVPALAGFTPRQSIIVVPFRRSRAHGAMRIDLPHDDDVASYAATAIGLVSRVSGVDAVAVVVYVDELPQHTPDGMVVPQSLVVDQLLTLVVDTGLHVVDALCVMPCGWSSYLDPEPELCPLAEIPDVPSPHDLALGQESGAGLPAVDVAETDRVGRALAALTAVITHLASDSGHLARHARDDPQALSAAALLDDLPRFFESLLDRAEEPPVFWTAALLWCLERPPLRDAAALQWATDLATGIRAFDAQLEYTRTAQSPPDDLGRMFTGQGDAPDVGRLRVALQLVRGAAARAPRAARPGPLTIAAWISWALGRATHAQHYLDLVADIDPEYSLARLLGALIDAAVLPEWVFRRCGQEAE